MVLHRFLSYPGGRYTLPAFLDNYPVITSVYATDRLPVPHDFLISGEPQMAIRRNDQDQVKIYIL